MSDVKTVCQAFDRTVAERPDEVALRVLGGGVSITWDEYRRRSRAIAAGLHGLGLRRGEVLGFMLVNRPEFNLSDTAAFSLGATCLSIYVTSSPEQIRNVLLDSGARIVVTEPQFVDQIRSSGVELDHLIVVADGGAAPDGAVAFSDVERAGAEAGLDVAALAAEVEPSDLLCLIYTSGTTGVSKGVQLTHANAVAEAEMFQRAIPIASGARTVSYLPSAHIGDRFLTHYNGIFRGMEVTTCPSMADLGAHLVDVRPQFLPSVPRVWEKMRASIESSYRRLGDAPEATAFWEALALGASRVSRGTDDAEPAAADDEAWNAADEAVMAPLRERLGFDALEHCVVGGAAGAAEMLEFFAALGVELLEVWGMTETTAIATVNPPGEVRFGSVGKPLPGQEIRLADDGEILVRGPNVTKGYRNMQAETEAAFEDGWFATGDIARLDDAGYLWVIDRKKDLIINAAGKNMSPTHIESVLKASSPLIAEACVIGDARPYNTALIVLDPESAADFVGSAGEDGTGDVAELASTPALREEIGACVEAANARLARVEQVKRWKLVRSEWAPGSDEMTLSMKLKRKPIAEKYAADIEELYRGSDDRREAKPA